MAVVTVSAVATFFSDETKSLQRGENHYKSNHIESFSYLHGILKGVVHASMKNKSYQVTVYLDENGCISGTECGCPRGNYKCSHAAALLIFGVHNVSRTDIECQWKKVKLAQHVKSVAELFPTPNLYNPISRVTTTEDHEWLRNELTTYGKFTGLNWLLTPEPSKPCLHIHSLDHIILSNGFIHADAKLDYLLEKLRLTDSQREEIEQTTVGQRENPDWLILRKGRLTASNFGCVLNAKRVTSSLMQRLLSQRDLSGVLAINWGICNEEEGVKAFSLKTGLKVNPSGLWVTPSGILGASPDGLVNSDSVLEVKCPYSFRESTIEEAVSNKKFCLEKQPDGTIKLNKQHQYYHQVQGQLYVTDRQWCFFVVWTTKDCHVLKIGRDLSWAPNMTILETFYKKNVIPRLITEGS